MDAGLDAGMDAKETKKTQVLVLKAKPGGGGGGIGGRRPLLFSKKQNERRVLLSTTLQERPGGFVDPLSDTQSFKSNSGSPMVSDGAERQSGLPATLEAEGDGIAETNSQSDYEGGPIERLYPVSLALY